MTYDPVRPVIKFAVILAGLVLLAVGVWRSGAVVPQLTLTHGSSAGAFGWEDVEVYELELYNEGLLDVRVEAMGRGETGMHLRMAEFPARLGAGETARVRLEYTITDCSAVPARQMPVPVKVRTWWGSVVLDVWSEGWWHRGLNCDVTKG